MPSLKSFFQKLKIANKQKIILVSLCLVLFCVLFPTNEALGGLVGDGIKNAMLNLASMFASFWFGIISLIVSAWTSITALLFTWAFEANEKIPLTRCPASDPDCIVDFAWKFVRDLANMIFILGMVVIAFATILGQESYGMKKLLPQLIITAILINFSQLFVGILVDFSSVLTGFFSDAVGSSARFVGDSVRLVESAISTGFTIDIAGDPKDQLNTMFSLLAMIFYLGVLSMIFLIYAGIFLLRMPMLWILTILSPLAFASRILPFARGFNLIGWDSWIKQVTQWAFIGTFSMFYLYLALNFAPQILALDTDSFGSGDSDSFGVNDIIKLMLPYFFLIILMVVGLLAASSTNAMFAGAAIGGAKRISGWAGNIGKRTAGAIKKETAPKIESRLHTREKADRLSGALSRMPVMRQTGVTEKIGAYGRGREGIISEGEKEAEKMSPNKIAQEVKNGKISNIGAVGALRKDGALAELEKLYGDDKQGFNNKMNTILGEGKRSNSQNVDKLIAKNPALSSLAQAQERLKDKAFERYKGEASYNGRTIKTKEDAWLEMKREALTKDEKENFDGLGDDEKKKYRNKAVATRIGIRENIKSFDPSAVSANFWTKEQNIDAALHEMRLEDLEKIGRENPAARSRIQSYLGSFDPKKAQKRYSKLTNIYAKPRSKERLENVSFDLKQLNALDPDPNIMREYREDRTGQELRSEPLFEEGDEREGRRPGRARRTMGRAMRIGGGARRAITGVEETIIDTEVSEKEMEENFGTEDFSPEGRPQTRIRGGVPGGRQAGAAGRRAERAMRERGGQIRGGAERRIRGAAGRIRRAVQTEDTIQDSELSEEERQERQENEINTD